MMLRSNAGLWNAAVFGWVALVAAPVYAQIQDVAPYYAVVQGKQSLRSRDGERFYSVADLPANSVLIVDGEGKEWARVVYPPGLSAFVRAEDVTVDGTTATLSRPSKLKSANAAGGFSASYMSLFLGELAPGTTLKVLEPAKENDGPVIGYRIAAPENSKGFVELRTLRRATDAEASAARSKNLVGSLPGAKPGVTTPADSATPASPSTTPPSTEPTNPAAPTLDLTQTPPASNDKPVEVIQKTDPNSPAGALPTNTTPPAPGSPEANNPPVVVAPPAPVKAPERKVSDLERLEPTFQSVLKQPVLEAEVDELISEYGRAIESIPATDTRRRQQAQARVDVLTLRQEFRNKLREQEDDRAKLDQSTTKIRTQLDELAKARYYTIIGQLQPSLVYNGRDLPQMFRVVSVGGTAPRTLGYLMKSDKFELDKMTGLVVGVIGSAQLDRSLQLNIINPVHVDVLKSVPVGAPAATTPAAPAEAAPKADDPAESSGQ